MQNNPDRAAIAAIWQKLGYADAAAQKPWPDNTLAKISTDYAAAYERGVNCWHQEQADAAEEKV